jgi:NTE family protein
VIPAPKYEATDGARQPGETSAARYRPARARAGMALCLSGGGFRATLFHLGALRRMNELGLLARIDTVTSVSGGSIMAAFLATKVSWPLGGALPREVWDREVAGPVRRFAGRNLRTPAIVSRWLRPWSSSAGARALMALYAKRLSAAKLGALPERPRFVFCATDMCYGVNFVFERARVGDYRLGYAEAGGDWDVARAVAASSCFPPVFNPLPLDRPAAAFKRGSAPSDDAARLDVRLSDGGLYDNLGLEPVWKDHRTVLVSDGGAALTNAGDGGLFQRLGRYVDIVANQAAALRKRWLISNFIEGAMSGTYWGIGSATASYGSAGAGYPPELVDEVIAPIRTDLDAFSAAECAVLENHGYALADAAIATHLPELMPAGAPTAAPPNPDWLDPTAVRAALAGSAVRRILGRW